MTWTREQFLARATLIEKQVERWQRGDPRYADTLRMELFALRLAAAATEKEGNE